MIKTGGGSLVPSEWVDTEAPCETCEGTAPGRNASYPPRDLIDPPCPEGVTVDLSAHFGVAGGDYVVFDSMGKEPSFPGSPVVTVTESPILIAWGTDGDGDGFPDPTDDCPGETDPDQADTDGDGVGDPCDNCPARVNPWQEDQDGDDHGDRCDCPGFDTYGDVHPGSDFDGDGRTACEEDCDDTDPEVHADHEEVPGNGVDDDCDGVIDEPCFAGLVIL